MAKADLEQVISRIALADRKAFDALYEEAGPKLFAVAMRMLKDREKAEDALQDVFVKIWQKASTYREGRQAPMAWLVTIARNHAIDMIRAEKQAHDDIEDHYELASSDPTPEQAAIGSGERQRISDCLNELEPRKAEAVVSAYIEGYSYQELSDRYEIPLNTMRTWLRRSLISLKDCLENG